MRDEPSQNVAPVAGVAEHYNLMIDEIDDPAHPQTDPYYDEGLLRSWMEQSDGPAFFQALGDVCGQAVLEIGVGTGRVAKKVLELGCAHLTGIDVSSKTLQRARRNLAAWPNIELLLCDTEEFTREGAFDAAYCVWAFFHVADQQRALANIVASLKPGGRLVLSLETVDEWLDYGPRLIRQYPVQPNVVVQWLEELNCHVDPLVVVYDTFAPKEKLASVFGTVIKAVKQ
ncbi:MAG: class I SAM-dependent methyltransferase [Armatimonadota bacterium]